MFNYFGSKTKLIKYYPKPKYNKIIEPFCGSARYSLAYPQHEIYINDLNPRIAKIWEYLINVDVARIEELPELEIGERVSGQLANVGNCKNGSDKVTKWGYGHNGFGVHKKKILKHLLNIRHWKISCLDYKEIPNEEATWFVDPPYQEQGHNYFGYDELNFEELGEWCKSRLGQVIVCEQDNANWLPFINLKIKSNYLTGVHKKTRMEKVWIQELK